MRKYEESIVCDKCGKILKERDELMALWGKKSIRIRFLKVFSNGGINVMSYDFCKDCAKEVEKAIETVVNYE